MKPPANTPRPVIDRLNAEIGKVLAKPDIQAAWRKQGAETMTMTADKCTEFLREDIEKWAKVVKTAGIKAD